MFQFMKTKEKTEEEKAEKVRRKRERKEKKARNASALSAEDLARLAEVRRSLRMSKAEAAVLSARIHRLLARRPPVRISKFHGVLSSSLRHRRDRRLTG